MLTQVAPQITSSWLDEHNARVAAEQAAPKLHLATVRIAGYLHEYAFNSTVSRQEFLFELTDESTISTREVPVYMHSGRFVTDMKHERYV